VCRAGYKGDNCGEAECKEPCLNGGRCIGPDKCACLYGYAGRRCEAGENFYFEDNFYGPVNLSIFFIVKAQKMSTVFKKKSRATNKFT
jgi:hypothetical protein